MFILNRQDVEIVNVPHPQKEGLQLPVLVYQRQTFGLLTMFGENREEALTYWRDLVDNKGKVCVLLEEPEIKRYSVWGKFSLGKEIIATKPPEPSSPRQVSPEPLAPRQVSPEPLAPKQVSPEPLAPKQVSPEPVRRSMEPIIPKLPEIDASKATQKGVIVEHIVTKACLMILRAIYLEINDLFGRNQGNLFKLDIMKPLKKEKFPQIDTIESLERLLATQDLMDSPTPTWNDNHLLFFLNNLYKIAQSHFGGTAFLEASKNTIADMSPDTRKIFQTWLTKMPNGQIWYK
nr:hypothetical protein [Pseudanabaena sp. PCC 6802]